MAKVLKNGRVVIMLGGKYAGKKAIVVKTYEKFDDVEKKKEKRKFSACLVVGLKRYGKKITKKMSNKKIEQRTRVKAFVKQVNQNHIIPTRYIVNDFNFLDVLKEKEKDKQKQKEDKSPKESLEDITKMLQEKYSNLPQDGERSSNLRFFYKKLRF